MSSKGWLVAHTQTHEIFQTVFEILADVGVSLDDETADETLLRVAEQVYAYSLRFGFERALAEDALLLLGFDEDGEATDA